MFWVFPWLSGVPCGVLVTAAAARLLYTAGRYFLWREAEDGGPRRVSPEELKLMLRVSPSEVGCWKVPAEWLLL